MGSSLSSVSAVAIVVGQGVQDLQIQERSIPIQVAHTVRDGDINVHNRRELILIEVDGRPPNLELISILSAYLWERDNIIKSGTTQDLLNFESMQAWSNFALQRMKEKNASDEVSTSSVQSLLVGCSKTTTKFQKGFMMGGLD